MLLITLRRLVAYSFLLIAMLLIPRGAVAQSTTGEYVTTKDTQLRSGPGENYGVVATIPQGLKINVVGREGYWLKVESKRGGKPGYVDEQDASLLQQGQRADATVSASAYRVISETDLREGPSLQQRSITRLPAGIKINVVRSEGDWLRVVSTRGGQPGYIQKRFAEPWTER
jgi:N-acetylmuramoyl-L-alanine amidase